MNPRERRAHAVVDAAVADGRVPLASADAWRKAIPSGYDPEPALKAVRPDPATAAANRATAAMTGQAVAAPAPVDEARVAELAASMGAGSASQAVLGGIGSEAGR